MDPDFRQQSSGDGWQISVQIPGLRREDLQITVEEGKRLRVVGKKGDSRSVFESIINLPPGFDPSQAKAVYLMGELRITFPKL